MANASEFVKCRKKPLVYYRGDFYEWTGTHYKPRSADAIRTEIYSFLNRAEVSVPGRVEGEWQAEPFRPNITNVRELFSALKHLEGKTFIPDDIDAPCWLRGGGNKPDARNLIALENSILDLETGIALPLSSDFFTMTALPFDYDPEAKCPEWQSFIAGLFPNCEDGQGTRREFQKAIGYMLSSDRSQQKIFLMKGPPRSGKGTTLRVLAALLGRENVVSPKLAELREHFGRQQLIGKKAAFFPDERLDGKTSEIVAWLLSISGEDDVSIPRKNRTNWNGRLDAKVWISTNPTPGFEDASAAIAERFVVFKLMHSHSENPDTGLTGRLLGELPGILNWAMEGLRMLREDRQFFQPEEAMDEIERMADIAAPIRVFVRERMVREAGRSVELREAYQAYAGWCESAGHKPLSRTKFETAILDAFPDVTRKYEGPRGKQAAVLRGIGLWVAGKQPETGEHAAEETTGARSNVVSIITGGRP
ncbi:MAG TPA: phage/plasmid primase, P4 family [Stellaceae bacterium]|nr:phage/plasmid primase, P4 family [Stellaceae bacterium]